MLAQGASLTCTSSLVLPVAGLARKACPPFVALASLALPALASTAPSTAVQALACMPPPLLWRPPAPHPPEP